MFKGIPGCPNECYISVKNFKEAEYLISILHSFGVRWGSGNELYHYPEYLFEIRPTGVNYYCMDRGWLSHSHTGREYRDVEEDHYIITLQDFLAMIGLETYQQKPIIGLEELL